MKKREIEWSDRKIAVSISGNSGGTHELFELETADGANVRELRPAEAQLLVWKRHGFIPAADGIFSSADLSDAEIRGVLDLVAQQEKRAFQAGRDAMKAELRKLIGVGE